MYKKYVNKRLWLNPISSSNSGAVTYSVSADLGDETWQGIDAEFVIWDCYRKVGLDFSMYDAKTATEVATKINALIVALEEFKVHLGKAWEDQYNV